MQSSSATAITIGPLKFILKHCLLHYKQTRQRYLYLLSSTNLPFGWWTLTNRRPTNSLMELLFPELKTHYRLMLDSKKLFLSTFLSILWNEILYILFTLLYMAPRRGFKPRTLALTVRCSITELTRNLEVNQDSFGNSSFMS